MSIKKFQIKLSLWKSNTLSPQGKDLNESLVGLREWKGKGEEILKEI